MEPNWIKFSITVMDMELWKDPFNEVKYTLKTNLRKVLVKDPMGPTKRGAPAWAFKAIKDAVATIPI